MTERPLCENCEIQMHFVLADIRGEKLQGWHCRECGLFLPIQTDTKVEIKLDKDTVLNGDNFRQLRVNKPVIYSIISKLKRASVYKDKIPDSIEQAIKYLKTLI